MKKTLALAEDHWSYFLALATIEEEKLIAQTILTREGSLLAYLLEEGLEEPVVNKTESQKPFYRTGLKSHFFYRQAPVKDHLEAYESHVFS